jgi:hypothetical protein
MAHQQNARGFAVLKKEGLSVSVVSLADVYKNLLLQAVDSSGSGTIFESALEQQVVKPQA